MRREKQIISSIMLTMIALGSTAPMLSVQAAATTTATTTPKVSTVLQFRELSIKKQTNQSSIDIKYPRLNRPLAQAAIISYVNKTVAEFQKTPAPDASRSYKNELVVSYKIYQSNNILSVVFTKYTFTGGAHGSTTNQAFNFDWKNGLPLKVSQIFSGNGYLRTTADIVRPILEKKIAAAMEIKELDKDGLKWLYDGTALS